MSEEIRYAGSEAKLGRIIQARLKPGTDLIAGIDKVCEDYGIENGVITLGIGSLRKTAFKFLIPNDELKLGSGYGDPYFMDGPIEFLGGQGLICRLEDGNRAIHLHGLLNRTSVEGGKPTPDYVFGGDLGVGKDKNPILATMDLMITELKGVKITRKYDDETEIPTRLDYEKVED
jgi:predicted DNA-binding protein with PD1-like motif